MRVWPAVSLPIKSLVLTGAWVWCGAVRRGVGSRPPCGCRPWSLTCPALSPALPLPTLPLDKNLRFFKFHLLHLKLEGDVTVWKTDCR